MTRRHLADVPVQVQRSGHVRANCTLASDVVESATSSKTEEATYMTCEKKRSDVITWYSWKCSKGAVEGVSHEIATLCRIFQIASNWLI